MVRPALLAGSPHPESHGNLVTMTGDTGTTERRYFGRAGLFLALAVGVWIGLRVYGWLLRRRVEEALGALPEPDMAEVSRLAHDSRFTILGVGTLLLILLLVFLGYFVAWLLALRARRLGSGNLPPPD